MVLTILVAPTVLYGIAAIIRQGEPPRWLLVLSPMSALFSAISPSATLGNSSISLMGSLGMLLGGNIGVFNNPNTIPRPLYHYTLPIYGMLTLIFYWLSTRLIRPARRWRLRWKEVLIAVVLIGLLISLSALVFSITSDHYENVSIFTAPTPFADPFAQPMMVQEAVVLESTEALPVLEDEASKFIVLSSTTSTSKVC